MYLAEGSNKSIVCTAIGTEPTNVYWKDETIIADDELRYDSLKQIFDNHKEKMLNCVAENEFGQDHRSVSIKIVSE